MSDYWQCYLLSLPPPEPESPELELLEPLSPLFDAEAPDVSLSDFLSRPMPVSPLMVSRNPWAKLPVSARCLPPLVEVDPGVNRLPPLALSFAVAALSDAFLVASS